MADTWKEGLTWLPDDYSAVSLPEGFGPLRGTDTERLARETAAAMEAKPSGDALPVRAAWTARLQGPELGWWRGLLAAALLLDTRECAARLETVEVDRSASPFAAALLEASRAERVTLVLLTDGRRRELLGTADPALGIVPPARPGRITCALPDDFLWFSPERGTFEDPTGLMDQRDRRLLCARLRCLTGAEAAAFAEDVEAADARPARDALEGEDQAAWRARLKAVSCLAGEPDYAALTVRTEKRLPSAAALLQAMGIPEPACALPSARTWLWKGVPFGSANEAIGIEPVRGSEAARKAAARAAEELAGETRLLEAHSRRWPAIAAARLDAYERTHALCGDAARQTAAWRQDLREADAVPREPAELTWPVDARSPAVRLLLGEALGESLAEAALEAFSDRLVLTPGGQLGDPVLDGACAVTIFDRVFTAVPPLGPLLAERLARVGGDGTGLVPDSLRFASQMGGGVEASFLLAGPGGQVRLRRIYRPEELITLEEAPQVSLWPSVPMEAGRWRVYLLSAKGDIALHFLRGGRWDSAAARADVPTVVRTDTFPSCVALDAGGQSAGALLCSAEVHRPDPAGEAVAAVDPGASGISLAMLLNGAVQPVRIPSVWRILLRGADAPLDGEILPALDCGPVLGSAVRLWTELDDPLPFEHGMLLPEDSAFSEDAIGSLLWRTDVRGRKGRRLMLRETMLLVSYHAAMNGAEAIRWRVTLPGAMAEAGRATLLEECARIAADTAAGTGLPAGVPAVEGLPAAAAEAAFLRQAWSSFAILDVGAAASGLSVWLRGMERPAAEASLSSGPVSLVASVYGARPDWLAEDLAQGHDLPVAELARQLTASSASVAAFDVAWRGVDALLGPRLTATREALAAREDGGRGSFLEALLLFFFAERLTLVGLQLEELRSSPAFADALPAELPLVLCGRGSQLIDCFDGPQRYQLTRFIRLSMRLDHPVRSVQLTLSGAPKMEAALGLVSLPELPALPESPEMAGAVPTVWLASHFLMLFRAALPAAAEVLFPGMFGAGGMLVPEAQAYVEATARRVTASAAQSFVLCLDSILMDCVGTPPEPGTPAE